MQKWHYYNQNLDSALIKIGACLQRWPNEIELGLYYLSCFCLDCDKVKDYHIFLILINLNSIFDYKL